MRQQRDPDKVTRKEEVRNRWLGWEKEGQSHQTE
jgi:hypothetical protein